MVSRTKTKCAELACVIKTMTDYVIKTEKTERQIRITIPKILARKAGIKSDRYCKIRVNKERAIVMEALDFEKTES